MRRSAAWISSAAASPSPARPNATAKPSPPVENTNPRCASRVRRTISSCWASAIRIASGRSSHSRVEPSMSVNRNVTVPVGRSRTRDIVARLGHARPGAAAMGERRAPGSGRLQGDAEVHLGPTVVCRFGAEFPVELLDGVVGAVAAGGLGGWCLFRGVSAREGCAGSG